LNCQAKRRFFYYDFIVLLFAYSGKYRTFASKFDVQMKKELGKVLIDIAKLVIGGVILAD